MKIGNVSPGANARKLLESNKFSVVGKVNESNLICGFEVVLKGKKTVYIPVSGGNYMAAWIKVYRLIKPTTK